MQICFPPLHLLSRARIFLRCTDTANVRVPLDCASANLENKGGGGGERGNGRDESTVIDAALEKWIENIRRMFFALLTLEEETKLDRGESCYIFWKMNIFWENINFNKVYIKLSKLDIVTFVIN